MNNEQSAKNFTYFDEELSTQEKHIYVGFEKLNSLLEQHDGNYDKLYESYLRVLGDEIKENNALDEEINNLINDKRVVVNKILDFGKLKYHPKSAGKPSQLNVFDMFIMK